MDNKITYCLQDTKRRSGSGHLLRECGVGEATALSDDLASHLLAESVLNQFTNQIALEAVYSERGGWSRPLTKTTRRRKGYTDCLLPY